MTEERLAEIEARVNAASPAPWVADNSMESHPAAISGPIDQETPFAFRRLAWLGSTGALGLNPWAERHRANARFIAAAREDVPALAAEVRRCWARIAELEAAGSTGPATGAVTERPPNWRRAHDLFGREQLDRYDRDIEGRATLWYAKVELAGDEWWGTVFRKTHPSIRAAQRRVVCRFTMEADHDGRWQLGPFSNSENAMLFTERWITTRRTPGTWSAGHPYFPVGDRLNLRIDDEPAAVEWARGAG